ncbi:hypothetical protein GLOTRDRAFT_140707 [Gloeophyllum trabeum ATCC 11539]|uniref:Vacuolar sorting protein 39/Transforming growth factor beta receptor-associated domain-containing protein n=1 Tax=Gloeophyllum trabeum (strain ATCC 11539 / FP-39264 / Madison 617) TaxID=670483 RepID=S7RDR7_GLOTA|nr:uncharacterized protein GLOTRDRAFT_140707 [Gloeophyllum trabeum ATCC 11539]EPQ52360.1 hypothetical protein GLOTRDRAFT_140707 [Gloeophyllum trabeum ATCC 11539]
MNGRVSFPRSGILVLGPNSVQSLVPATLVSQAESLLENHRISEAADFAEQQRKKLQSKISLDDDEASFVEELRYVFQRIGLQCFSETLFEDAGQYLLSGELDPRILVSYFPEYRGDMFAPEDSIDMFAGVAEHIPEEDTVVDIIAQNLVRNYSPHLKPNTREARPTAELREILKDEARRMLHNVLQAWHRKARVGDKGLAAMREVRMVVDTALLKILAENGDTPELHRMLDGPNDVDLSEVEPILIQSQQFNVLCKLYRQRGEEGKLLDAWAKLAEGEWTDEDLPDPLTTMFNYLSEKRDRALIQRWGVWFTTHDPERGLKASSSYASSSSTSSSTSFLSYFVSTTPDSEHKRVRLKTILFLQGSDLYDPEPIKERLAEYEKTLVIERAIVEGKLGHHREALTILMHTLHDSRSAESYCTLGGDVVTGRLASSIGEKNGLLHWSSLLTGGKSKTPGAITRQQSADEETRKTLLGILLEVCMSGGESTSESTARLLNSQAMNLDVVDVISLVPPDWPLHLLSSFLSRSFRRTLHSLHEGQIVKNISMAQNLEVSERTWMVIREQGALIEEPVEDEEGEEGDGEKEKVAEILNEKFGLHEDGPVEEIHVDDAKEGDGGDNKGLDSGIR